LTATGEIAEPVLTIIAPNENRADPAFTGLVARSAIRCGPSSIGGPCWVIVGVSSRIVKL